MRCRLCGEEIQRRPDGGWEDDLGDQVCRLARSGRHQPDEWSDGGNVLTAPAFMTAEL